MSISYEERLPSAAEYSALRFGAGWSGYDLDTIRRYLPASVHGVCALDAGVVVGMARVVGDGGLCFYVQDVMVSRDHQMPDAPLPRR